MCLPKQASTADTRRMEQTTPDIEDMSIAARLMTTTVAGLGGFMAVGIQALFMGRPAGYIELATVMLLFTSVYVPGVFASRRFLHAYAIETGRGSASPAKVR